MNKIHGTLAYTSLCAFLLTLACTTAAEARSMQADGCSDLAAVIRTEIESLIASRQFGASTGQRAMLPSAGRAVSCGTVTAVASAAFSEAFAGFGTAVNWNQKMPPDAGDYCLGHRLDQCYPDSDGFSLAFSQAAIRTSWNAVSRAIERQMPLGTGSDIAYFDPAMLREVLAVSLRVLFKPRFDAPPDCPPPLGPCRLY